MKKARERRPQASFTNALLDCKSAVCLRGNLFEQAMSVGKADVGIVSPGYVRVLISDCSEAYRENEFFAVPDKLRQIVTATEDDDEASERLRVVLVLIQHYPIWLELLQKPQKRFDVGNG